MSAAKEALVKIHGEVAIEMTDIISKINTLFNTGSDWSHVGSAEQVLKELKQINDFLGK